MGPSEAIMRQWMQERSQRNQAQITRDDLEVTRRYAVSARPDKVRDRRFCDVGPPEPRCARLEITVGPGYKRVPRWQTRLYPGPTVISIPGRRPAGGPR